MSSHELREGRAQPEMVLDVTEEVPRLPASSAGGSSRGSGRSGKAHPISPVLETEIELNQSVLQAQDYVRYGDSIKLWASSQYLKNEGKGKALPASSIGGYVGVYEKTDGTARVTVPPIGEQAEGTFKESILKIQSPNNKKEVGTEVRYGDSVVLVDENGQVWNNKCGTGTFSGFFEGYLGPKPRGSNGEVYVTFKKNGHGTRPLIYGENAVYIDVVASHRTRSSYNYRLTNYKSSSSRVSGGYVCSDGTGFDLPFSVHRLSGPPGKVYEGPRAGSRSASQLSISTVDGEVYELPNVNSVIVERKEGADVMITNLEFGSMFKLYDVNPEDNIVLNLEQPDSRACIRAQDIFNAAKAMSKSLSGSVEPLQISVTVGPPLHGSPPDSGGQSNEAKQGSTNSSSGKTLYVTALELLVEQNDTIIQQVFGDTPSGGQSSSIEEPIQFGKLDLLIATHKLVMVYFTLAVVLPYCMWQFVLIVGDLIGPIHEHSTPDSSLVMVESAATLLVKYFGIQVDSGKAMITTENREMETSTLTSTLFALGFCFALGLTTPDFARCGPLAKSQDANQIQQSNAQNLLVSAVVPEGAWVRPKSTVENSPESNPTSDNSNDNKVEVSGPSQSASPAPGGAKLEGVWGEMGVDENGVPKHPAFARFLAGEKGNMDNAKARWTKTCLWRKEGNIDNILEQPHPNFDIITKNQPSFYYGRNKVGFPVYIDCPGQVKLKKLKNAGLSLADLLFHFVYSTEFLWTMLEPSEEARAVSILDLEGIGVWDFAGDVIDFVKKTIALSGEHYPERAHRIYIVNAPRFFTGIWSMIKPMLDEATKKKIGLYRSNYKDALLEDIDAEQLPEKYGGLNPEPLGQSVEDRLLRSHVCRTLVKLGVPMKDESGNNCPGSPENLQQFIDDSIEYGVSKLKK
mmetsp:Transcript_17866/g.32978  ORF Transcript_17866/g.32978 Transcript_17866/m.32978 type:complete len:912 (+) Transcript_17866:61-2796(+)